MFLPPGDALEFMSWFLNALHGALNGTKKLSSSIINKTFRGKMKVYSRKVPPLEMVSSISHVACNVQLAHIAQVVEGHTSILKVQGSSTLWVAFYQ